jgi:hypothetical protein
MSFFLHKDCGQVPVVTGEEKEASPPLYPHGRTPWGYVGLVQVRGTPRKLPGPPCRAVFHRNVVAPIPDKMPGTTSNKPSSISRRVRQ